MATRKSWGFEKVLGTQETQLCCILTGPWGINIPLDCTQLYTSKGQVAHINLPNHLNGLEVGHTGLVEFYTREHREKYIIQSNGYVLKGVEYLELYISDGNYSDIFTYSGKDKDIIHTDYCDKLQKFIKDTFEMDVKISMNETNLTFELQTPQKTLTFSNKSGEFCKISTCDTETSLPNAQQITLDKFVVPGGCIPQMVASLELSTPDNPPQDLFEQAISHLLSPLENYSLTENKPKLYKRFFDDKFLAISVKYELVETLKDFVKSMFPFVNHINITVSKLIKSASITCEALPNMDNRRYFQIARNLHRPIVKIPNVTAEAQR